MSYNEYKNTESNRRGSKAEDNFKKLFESKGYKIREATSKENKLFIKLKIFLKLFY